MMSKDDELFVKEQQFAPSNTLQETLVWSRNKYTFAEHSAMRD